MIEKGKLNDCNLKDIFDGVNKIANTFIIGSIKAVNMIGKENE